MHTNKCLHRDIQPINLSLAADGSIKVGEFGLSKQAISWDLKSVKQMDAFYYLAPELLRGKEPSELSDIWALGVTLYELCYLKRPFQNGPQLIVETKIKAGGYDDTAASFSDEMRDIIRLMLTVDIDMRQSIEDILRHPLLVPGY